MKSLKILTLSVLLLVGNLYAKKNEHYLKHGMIKNYQITITSEDELKIGNNDIEINVEKKSKPLTGLNMKLTVTSPDNKTIKYTHIKNKKNDYNLTLNLDKKGEYTYALYFSKNGGVIHIVKGTFNI